MAIAILGAMKKFRDSAMAVMLMMTLALAAGAVALAALLAGKAPVDGHTAVMLTGGNVDPARFAEVLAS